MEKEGEPAKDEKKQKPKRRIGDRIKSPEKFTEQKMIPPRVHSSRIRGDQTRNLNPIERIGFKTLPKTSSIA